MFRRIVVGFEDTAEGRDALALASAMGGAAEAELVLCLVYPVPYYYPLPYYYAPAENHEEMRRSAEGVLERADNALPAGVRARHKPIADFSAAKGLQAVAQEEHAELIVIGSTTKGPVARVTTGTVGERLLHGSPCGVAVAPKGYAAEGASLEVVGVAFDGSQDSKVAVEAAEPIARAAGARLRVYTVVPPFPAWSLGAAMASTTEQERAREYFRKALDAIVDGIDPALGADPVLLDGDPAEALRDEAEGLSLLVMGSRRYGPLRRVLLGSVSSALLRESPCPVLVTPRAEREPVQPTTADLASTDA